MESAGYLPWVVQKANRTQDWPRESKHWFHKEWKQWILGCIISIQQEAILGLQDSSHPPKTEWNCKGRVHYAGAGNLHEKHETGVQVRGVQRSDVSPHHGCGHIAGCQRCIDSWLEHHLSSLFFGHGEQLSSLGTGWEVLVCLRANVEGSVWRGGWTFKVTVTLMTFLHSHPLSFLMS